MQGRRVGEQRSAISFQPKTRARPAKHGERLKSTVSQFHSFCGAGLLVALIIEMEVGREAPQLHRFCGDAGVCL